MPLHVTKFHPSIMAYRKQSNNLSKCESYMVFAS